MSKKAPSQVVKPPKDLYINEPHFLKRWHAALLKNRWLRGGILALILGLFAAGLVLLALRVWEPPELGKLLPQSTVHYQQTPTQGVAWLANGETPLYFYPQQKRFRQYEVVAENPAHLEVLEQVRRGEIPALSQDPFFQAMRPALPYRADFFEFYRTAEKIEDFFPFNPSWQKHLTPFENALKNMAENAFPVFGRVVESTEVGKLTQAYVAGDKEFKSGNTDYPYFFHLEKKYKGKLLPLLPDTLDTVYGGEQLATTTEQLTDLLNFADQTPIGDTHINAKADAFFEKYFGTELSREAVFDPLLDNEYAFGIFPTDPASPSPRFVFALELTPETTPLLEQLVQTITTHGIIQIDREKSSIKSEPLTPQRTEYNGALYDMYLRPNGQVFIAALIKDDVAILATGKAEMEQSIDAMNGTGRYMASEKYRMIEPLIDRVDHLRATGNRAVGVNLFDDGMMIFTHAR